MKSDSSTNWQRTGAVAMALLLVVAGGTATGVAAGPADESATDASSTVVLQNATIEQLELANTTIENVVVREMVVETTQIDEGDEVEELNASGEASDEATVFRNVALEELSLETTTLSDLEASSLGPLENLTTDAGEENGMEASAGENATDEADESATDGNGAAASADGEGEHVLIENLTIQQMSVDRLTIGNLTVTEDESGGGIIDAVVEFVSGAFEGGDGEEADGNETGNETDGAANETAVPTDEEANDTGGMADETGNETTANGAAGDAPEADRTIEEVVVEDLSVSELAIGEMTVETFRSGNGTEAVETPTEGANDSEGVIEENETDGLLGGNETETETEVIETMSIGNVTIDSADADIWVIGETEQRNASDGANETAATPDDEEVDDTDGMTGADGTMENESADDGAMDDGAMENETTPEAGNESEPADGA